MDPRAPLNEPRAMEKLAFPTPSISFSFEPRGTCGFDDLMYRRPSLRSLKHQVEIDLAKRPYNKTKSALLRNEGDWQNRWWLRFQPMAEIGAFDQLYRKQELETIMKSPLSTADCPDAPNSARTSKAHLVAVTNKVVQGKISKAAKHDKLKKTKPKAAKKL